MAELLEPFAGTGAFGLAGRLIRRFGSIGKALEVDSGQWSDFAPSDQVILRQLSAARRLADLAAREAIIGEPIEPTDQRFLGYMRRLLSSASSEKVHSTYLDRNGIYILDEPLCSGSAEIVSVSGRHLVERAFAVGAHGVILAHNHPSGSSEPSSSDIDATRRLAALLRELDLDLVDHLIVGRSDITSMRKGGFLNG